MIHESPLSPHRSPFNSHSPARRQTSPSVFQHRDHNKEQPKSFFNKILFHRSHLTRTMPYTGSQDRDDRIAKLKAFRCRPLPPLPTLSQIMNSDSPFHHNILHDNKGKSNRNHIVTTSEANIAADFEQMKNRLLNNSHENLHFIDYRSNRKNTLSEFRKHKSTIKFQSATNRNNSLRAFRSNSLDDEFLSVNTTKSQQKVMRRSRSLDILDENITINELYIELQNFDDAFIVGKNHDKSKLPYDANRRESTLQKDEQNYKSITEESDSLHKTSNLQKHESMYAKIPDLPIDYKIDIQKRPMPVPNELQTKSTEKEHIYQRASILDIDIDLPYKTSNNKIKATRHLSDQLASFCSISSAGSGQYAKIPETNRNIPDK